MIYLLTTVVMFGLTVIGHIAVHRILMGRGMKNFLSIGVFSIGFLLEFLLIWFLQPTSNLESPWLYPLPVSSAFLYILLFFAYIIYIASPYLGQVGPTAKVLAVLQKHPRLSARKIIESYTDREIIGDRIDDLLRVGWVAKLDRKLVVLPKGARLITLLLWYRSILGMTRGG